MQATEVGSLSKHVECVAIKRSANKRDSVGYVLTSTRILQVILISIGFVCDVYQYLIGFSVLGWRRNSNSPHPN